jgi:hypothetical protein
MVCVCACVHPPRHAWSSGRLPIRVELKGLTEEDLYRILTEPVTNIITQQVGPRRNGADCYA